MRKALDLFANLRPVKVPEQGIDWTFFRENTEGAYAVGSMGVNVTDDLALDFVVTTSEGCDRIARLAYDYARRNNKGRVSIITKANVIKTTDGKFLNLCKKVGEEYPDIVTDEWYIDITTAKLIDEKRRRDFKVFILPNLYGDIITDEAAEFQGGVGTAGSANIGKRYAMFEAIHGSAPRMVREGRAQYADPCSMLRASVMLLSHIGEQEKADLLERALDICMYEDKKLKITVYLSLGDREEKTRNPVMSQVGNCIQKGYDWLTKCGINCTLEWNQGNHFREPDIRTAKAFAWVMAENHRA